MIRHDMHWTLEELDRQHARSLKERVLDLWGAVDRRLLLWIVLTVGSFFAGWWLWN